jgi:isopentenyl phosphate kinase
MTTVLKLGGSVITKKDEAETIDEQALDRAVDSIASHLDGQGEGGAASLVLVHGGGSFGHQAAATHGVSTTEGTRDAAAIQDIHAAMGRLNAAVIQRLHEASVSAIPIRPLSIASRTSSDGETVLNVPTGQLEMALAEGFVPVLHGDIVVESGAGATILSGDELVVALAESLDADAAGLCSTVPGVLDASDDVIPTIESFDDVATFVGESDATDVTGGMAGKVKVLLDLDSPASIFALDELDEFLTSGSAGTVIR